MTTTTELRNRLAKLERLAVAPNEAAAEAEQLRAQLAEIEATEAAEAAETRRRNAGPYDRQGTPITIAGDSRRRARSYLVEAATTQPNVIVGDTAGRRLLAHAAFSERTKRLHKAEHRVGPIVWRTDDYWLKEEAARRADVARRIGPGAGTRVLRSLEAERHITDATNPSQLGELARNHGAVGLVVEQFGPGVEQWAGLGSLNVEHKRRTRWNPDGSGPLNGRPPIFVFAADGTPTPNGWRRWDVYAIDPGDMPLKRETEQWWLATPDNGPAVVIIATADSDISIGLRADVQ